MSWQQLSVYLKQAQAETASACLEEAGALSVSLSDAEDQALYEPALNTMPLWHKVLVKALFEAEADMCMVQEQLENAVQEALECTVGVLEDQDWVRAGQDFEPLRFGRRLWICPSWAEVPQAEAVNILLDPGLAFGTGTHPTTALCLQWLDAQADLDGMPCIDYGCGSGILAIAAVKLGASKAFAVDNDPQALLATRDNAGKNGVVDKIETFLPGQLPAGKVPVLLANILANPLCELAEHFAGLVETGGQVVLSGILRDQGEVVGAAYRPWFDIQDNARQDDWLRLVMRRKA